MTRAVRDRMLKDGNGNISDHLRNHIHLTNCIHLKNHMHRHSPILSDRALLRDLVALQRSRSLRDPSTSPRSPSAVDILGKRGQRDDFVSGRLSFGIEHSKEYGRMMSPIAGIPASKSAVGQLSRRNGDGVSECGSKETSREHRRVKTREELSGIMEIKEGSRPDQNLKSLSDLLKDIATESDVGSSHLSISKRHGSSKGLRKRRASRTTRRSAAQNEMPVDSNSLGLDEQNDQNFNSVPQNGCGMPWNWSRIHDRGKSLLDMAGRSLSCGLSDTRFRKGGSTMDIPDMPLGSELSSSSNGGEAFPLLLDASGSHGGNECSGQIHDYSGELSLFSNNFGSDGRSIEQHKFRKHHNGRHKNLTQKYTPRTFKDLVGQGLVVQALSNAIAKRKVGSLYLFYGPHGTGKTSCARIFARALNCQSTEHPCPCGLCNSCIAQNKGKARNVKEIGPVVNFDFENILRVLGKTITSKTQSQYRVLIFDACDAMDSECWSAILQAINRAPRRVVFILICSSLENLPHLVISRCQKFFFPKLKDADIIYTLQWIATKEELEIDKDALKLIASRSDGSLRDAEMTLEQLSLIGKRISLDLVQELAGLISDEKLIDLLDFALSADTVNTVKNLRDITESGVDPLALMSQLAAVITDILAGSHCFITGRARRKFFRQEPLSKEDMEKLRQALKTLSEAEKQLRVSNDRITWLTAALLQLAPDQQYLLPNSSTDNTFIERPRKSNAEMSTFRPGTSGSIHYSGKLKASDVDGNPIHKVQLQGRELDEIWLGVLEKIPNDSVKVFLRTEGKLISVSYGTAPAVELLFNSELTKSKAERFLRYISEAFESALQTSSVAIEIRSVSRKDAVLRQIQLPRDPSRLDIDMLRFFNRDASTSCTNRQEIVEIPENTDMDRRNIRNSTVLTDESNQSLSLVRSRLSLARAMQLQEGGSENNGWSKQKAISIAEKLEQENLRLEPTSRRVLCWNPPKRTRRKLPRLRIRARKPKKLLKYVSCGQCFSSRTPR